MAEQEIIKHTKKIFSIMGDKQSSWWHKLKEFVVEILIIVIAITLSIWFHNQSEHRHEQAAVRTFLLGLKEDLKTDTADINSSLNSYDKYRLLYSYLSGFEIGKKPDPDSLSLALHYINSYSYFRVHSSRFTGFLTAGKILTIEDDKLAQDILDYYQELVPALEVSEDDWIAHHKALVDYMVDNSKKFKDDTEQWEILTHAKAKYLCNYLIPWPQLLDRYDKVLNKAETIISRIDSGY